MSEGEVSAFERTAAFTLVDISGMVGLGRLEVEHRPILPTVLEDGVITQGERAPVDSLKTAGGPTSCAGAARSTGPPAGRVCWSQTISRPPWPYSKPRREAGARWRRIC